MKKYIRIGLLAIGVVIIFSLIAIIFTLPQIPDDLNAIALSNPTKIYAQDGQLVKMFANREVVELDQVSSHFINAILSLEDAGFYHHHGFSKKSWLRALVKNIYHMRVVEGGSTITQQLAKNLFFAFHRSYTRKIKEFFVALQLEQQFSKDQILEAYINQIPFGSGVYGVELAAQMYFAKHADELTLAEAAMLAGIPRWPTRYNPYRHEDVAKQRQAFVLKRMENKDFITQEERENAAKEELILGNMNQLYGHAEYFTDFVRKKAVESFGEVAVDYGGLRIYTTLDPKYQYEASMAVKQGLAQLDELMGLPPFEEANWEQKQTYPQAALVAIDPRSGAIKAMVGGRDYRFSQYNRALINNRSAGSAFKPFNYVTALDRGLITPATVLVDEPFTYKYDRQVWSPQNFDGRYDGPMIVKWALMQSRNVISAKVIKTVGADAVADYAKKFGIDSPVNPLPSIALGATAVSPIEMATAYCTFANQGIQRHSYMIRHIETADGNIIENSKPTSRRVVDAQTCYMMVDMLKGVVEEGTAGAIRARGFTRPCAGKTGTTNDFRDAWFIGFTPELVTAVWVGFDDNHQMFNKSKRGITGAAGAVPIWTLFMKNALDDKPWSVFPIPAGIDFIELNPFTGAGALPGGKSITVAVRSKLLM